MLLPEHHIKYKTGKQIWTLPYLIGYKPTGADEAYVWQKDKEKLKIFDKWCLFDIRHNVIARLCVAA